MAWFWCFGVGVFVPRVYLANMQLNMLLLLLLLLLLLSALTAVWVS
jgi:hypothetical protein